MTIFPLDAVRNARIDQQIEVALQEVRDQVVAFPFSLQRYGLDLGDVLEVYDLARPRLNVLVSLLRDLRGKRGADISTGLGFLPVLLDRYGLTAVATEQEIQLAYFAAANSIEIRHYELGRTPPPFESETLDFVVLGELLEHLKVPAVAVMREMAGLLRVGGRLALSTPNVARLAHVEALIAGENFLEPFPEDLPPDADPTDYLEHVREYSIREVVEAVEAAGLGVDRVVMSGWGEAGYQLHPNPYANEIIVLTATK